MDIDGETFSRMAANPHMTVGVNAVRPEAVERGVSSLNHQIELANHCMKLIKPVRYAGERDPEVLDKFITFLQRYFRFCPNCEEEKVIMAACFLDEEASQWWNQECGTEALPSGI